jgi:hypothetical protein
LHGGQGKSQVPFTKAFASTAENGGGSDDGAAAEIQDSGAAKLENQTGVTQRPKRLFAPLIGVL